VNELVSRTAITATNEPARDKLRVGIQSDPSPSVAASFCFLVRRGVLRFRADERPDLIALDALTGEIHENLGLVSGARGSKIHKKLLDRGAMRSGHPNDRAEAVSFHKGGNDADAFGGGQLVHAGETSIYA